MLGVEPYSVTSNVPVVFKTGLSGPSKHNESCLVFLRYFPGKKLKRIPKLKQCWFF